MSKRCTPKETKEIIAAYLSGASCCKAAALHGKSGPTCMNLLKAAGLESRHRKKYQHNDSFFSEISTEHVAYVLGFISADGCIGEYDGKKQLSIHLSWRDAQHLEHLRDLLSPDAPVRKEKNGARFLCIGSGRMFDDLMNAGLTPRKSLTLQKWNGPDYLLRHYWRGIIDGDGTLGKTKSTKRHLRRFWLGVVGSEAVVSGFRDWLHHQGVQPTAIIRRANIYQNSYMGVQKPASIARLLYEDCKIALPRKLALAKQLVKEAFDYDMAGEAFVPPEMCAPRPKISFPKS